MLSAKRNEFASSSGWRCEKNKELNIQTQETKTEESQPRAKTRWKQIALIVSTLSRLLSSEFISWCRGYSIKFVLNFKVNSLSLIRHLASCLQRTFACRQWDSKTPLDPLLYLLPLLFRQIWLIFAHEVTLLTLAAFKRNSSPTFKLPEIGGNLPDSPSPLSLSARARTWFNKMVIVFAQL